MKVEVKKLRAGMICDIPEPTLPNERVRVDLDPEPCNCRAGFEMGKYDLYVNAEAQPRHFLPDFIVTVVS